MHLRPLQRRREDADQAQGLSSFRHAYLVPVVGVGRIEHAGADGVTPAAQFFFFSASRSAR